MPFKSLPDDDSTQQVLRTLARHWEGKGPAKETKEWPEK